MAVLLKFLIPFLLLLILSLEVYAGIVTCQAASTDGKETPSTCNGILHEPVCLLCSVRKSSKHISWTIESTTLAYEKHNLNASHAGGLTVNECDSDEYYSLRLQRPSVQYNNLRYKCRRDEEIVSEFILTLHVEAVLSINNSLISNGTFFLGFNESTQTLVCVITKAVPPFTLNWSINNVFKGTKVFNISSTTPTTCRYSMTFYDLETEDKLTCSSEGLFLQNDTITLTTIRALVPDELDLFPEVISTKNGILYILIGAPFLIAGFPIVIIWLICRCVSRKPRENPTDQYSTDLYLTPIDSSTGVFTSLGDNQVTCQAVVHEGFPLPPNLALPEIPCAAIPDYCDTKIAEAYADTIENPFKLLENSSRRKKPNLPPRNKEKEKPRHVLPPNLPLSEIPPEKIAEYSDGENENYYATTEQTTGTARGRIFHEKDICPILEIKKGKLYIRWMGTIASSTEANKCVIMTTVTGAVLKSKDIQWDAFVKRAMELPKSNNLSKIEGIGVVKGKIHLIHEYLVYGTLDDRINSAGNTTESGKAMTHMSPPEVMRHLLGILEGMELIHSYGFLHPGLTTQKILLSDQGICKLYDFCLSEDAGKIITVRRAKAVSYENQLPPEVTLRCEYSSSSDVWAVAVVIWEMMSHGDSPFPSPNDNIYGIKLKPPSPSKLPKDYKHISKSRLFECWNRKESSRPTINQLRLSCIKVIKSQVDTYNIPEIYFGSTKSEYYVPMTDGKNGDKS